MTVFLNYLVFSSSQLILECPDDIYCFQFSPSDPNIIAGGCFSGQVLISFKNKIGYFCLFLQYKKRLKRCTQQLSSLSQKISKSQEFRTQITELVISMSREVFSPVLQLRESLQFPELFL